MRIMNEIKVRDIYNVINEFAPFVFQEEWDNSGLQIGSLHAKTRRALLVLDVTKEAVEKAVEYKIDLIISHHPLIFKPLKCIDFSNSIINLLSTNDINVISAHTSLDAVYDGVSYQLAKLLGIDNLAVLSPKKESKYCKLSFFLPTGYETPLLKKIFDLGVGEYNFYKDCAFESVGEGRFIEKREAKPFIESFKIYKEAKIELIVRVDKLAFCINTLKEFHPYQEVAFDVFPEVINPISIGHGCVGNLKVSKKLSQLINICKEKLGVTTVRYTGDLNKKIKRVAVCGGSGGSLIVDAINAGADVYITGDLKYHEVLENKDKISIIDVGHRASEQPVLNKIEEILKARFKNLKIYQFIEHKDFFSYY